MSDDGCRRRDFFRIGDQPLEVGGLPNGLVGVIEPIALSVSI
jgi:hypothetical protein